MYFLRKISGLVSGIKTKKLTIEGREVKYSFQGKFIAINPFSMLRDFSYKGTGIAKINSEIETIDLTQLNVECLPDFGNELNIRAESKIQNKNISIERSVKKMDQTPHTCYEFFLDEVLCARLIKKYDYGCHFQTVINHLKDSITTSIHQSASNQIFWKSGNQFLLVENFGHTHIYICYDLDLLLRIGNMVS